MGIVEYLLEQEREKTKAEREKRKAEREKRKAEREKRKAEREKRIRERERAQAAEKALKEKNKITAKNFKAEGVDISIIAKVTGLPVEEIEKL
jgi:hypothetical protein